MVLESELQADAFILLMHLRSMARSLRALPADRWNWTFAPPAPTPRILAQHTLSWLQCDRQHIENPNVRTHRPVPEPPAERDAMCDALEQEADAWEELLKGLRPEDLLRAGRQFGREEALVNVRWFVAHMVQNVIYKHGQFSTIFYALGLDGEEPYDAPFPNRLYKSELGIE